MKNFTTLANTSQTIHNPDSKKQTILRNFNRRIEFLRFFLIAHRFNWKAALQFCNILIVTSLPVVVYSRDVMVVHQKRTQSFTSRHSGSGRSTPHWPLQHYFETQWDKLVWYLLSGNGWTRHKIKQETTISHRTSLHPRENLIHLITLKRNVWNLPIWNLRCEATFPVSVE